MFFSFDQDNLSSIRQIYYHYDQEGSENTFVVE